MPTYRVFLPLSFEAYFVLDADTADQARVRAIAAYQDYTPEQRINAIGGGLIVDFDGDGAVIGRPIIYEEPENDITEDDTGTQ